MDSNLIMAIAMKALKNSKAGGGTVKLDAVNKAVESIVADREQIAKNKTDIALLKEDLSNKITKFYASNQGETHITDSDNGKIQYMKVFGKSEQKKYNGYQLLPLAPINKTTGEKLNLPYTENGITVDIANDGIGYTLRGTNTLDRQVDVYLCMGNEFDIDAGTYTRSGKIINGNSNVRIISGSGLKNDGVFEYKDYKSDFTFTETVEKGKSGNFLIRILQNATVNATVYFQIEKGSVAHDYEPYTGGIPSPSPEYPQEIKSVVNPIIKVRGKNLLRYPYVEGNVHMNGIVFTDNKDGSISVSGTATGTSYYNFFKKIDGKSLMLASGTYKLVVKGRSKCNVVVNNGVTSVKNEGTITIKDGFNETYCYIMVQEGVTVDETIYPMIQFVSITDESYEPYKEQFIQLPITLNAIPVQSGGNVTIDGQQYISDYVDVEHGKVVKRVGIANQESFHTLTVNDNVIALVNRAADTLDGNSSITTITSGYYKGWTPKENKTCHFSQLSSQRLVILLAKGTTLEQANEILKNGFEFWYSLLTPIEEELTTEQVQALKELTTYYPVTNITVGSEQLYGYTAFNYPVSMANGWNYVKQQLNDNRDYIYDMDLQSAEAYVNSEYAVALTELEVM